jgi:Sulfatase
MLLHRLSIGIGSGIDCGYELFVRDRHHENQTAHMFLNAASSSDCSVRPGRAGAGAGDKIQHCLRDGGQLRLGEPGVYGGGVLRGAPTPRIDQLASEGVRLLNFNVESQCVPSRSALLTGRHPIRSGTTKVVWGMLYGLVQWERTIAELLSEQGHATAL